MTPPAAAVSGMAEFVIALAVIVLLIALGARLR